MNPLNNVDIAPGERLLFLHSSYLTQAKLFFGFALALPALPAALARFQRGEVLPVGIHCDLATEGCTSLKDYPLIVTLIRVFLRRSSSHLEVCRNFPFDRL